MASISTSIELYDKVSSPIYKMLDALNSLTSGFESIEASMNDSFDTSQIAEARNKIEQAAQEVNQLGNEIDENTSKQDRFNRELDEGADKADSLVAKLAGMAGAVVGLNAIKDQFMSAIDYASDLTEVQNVVDVAFGKSSSVVDEWATTTLEAFGLNELSAKKFAGTMGAMLKSSGMAGKKVTDMSMKIVELAGDMASFYNLSGEEAFNKIRSGISGETEPLKQLGINMSVANLEAYALSQGIKKAYSEMSQADQVALRYEYLLQATADAQGDFARTSNSFANQTKLLSESWQEFTGYLATGALPVLTSVIGGLNTALSGLVENWSIITPLLYGVAAALALVNAPLIAQGALWLWNTILVPAYNAVVGFLSLGYGVLTGNTAAASAATLMFNNALLASPITWILLIIIAIVAALYAVVAAINKVTGSTISATGVLVGAIMAAVAFVWNLFLGLVDLVLACINYMVNPWIAFANFFGNLFNDPIGSIIHLFGDMADNILGVIESIAKALDKVFGSNLAGAVQGWRSGLDSKIEAVANEYGNGSYEKVMDNLNLSSEDLGLKRWAYSDAYDLGYSWGEGIDESVSNMFGGSESGASNPFSGGDEYGGYDASQIPSNIADVAENTGDMKDSLEITGEDLKYLRDLAEQEAVNRFTTAEIRVEMTNNNNVSSGMDLDGMVDYLANGVNEAMQKAAEGVHV